jgi:glycosyltransferase involved in cell wall biosynthesis
MVSSADRVREIVAVCSLPPPVNGQTIANAFYSNWLQSLGSATVIDLVPGMKISRRLIEIVRAALAALSLRPGTVFYTVPHASRGKLITRLLVEIAFIRGAHVVLHHHGFNYLAKPCHVYRSLFVRHNHGIYHIFLASEMAEAFRRTYGVEPSYFIVNNSLLVEHSSEQVGQESANRDKERIPVIGLMSNLNREKGLHTFLDVLCLAKERNVALRGVLAGPIASADDRQLVARMRNDIHDLEYLGPVYGAAKEAFFRSIDLFVFPTTYPVEAQPLVVYEAILRGRYVVSNNMGCIPSMAHQPWLRTTHGPRAEDYLSATQSALMDIDNRAASANPEDVLAEKIEEAQASLNFLGEFLSMLISPKSASDRLIPR